MASFWEITPPAQYLKQVAENPPPPSFAKQGTLPRLPVPQLNATLDKVRLWSLPLVISHVCFQCL